MSNFNIRIANEKDTKEIHQLMYDAFTPLRELGIDWPSVNASVEMVKDNIKNNTTFVLELDNTIISTITVRYPWGSVRSISGYPFVWWFATKPEFDGLGYGSQLLKYVEEDF